MNLLKALFLLLFLLGDASSFARLQDVERECAAGALVVQGVGKVVQGVNFVVDHDPSGELQVARAGLQVAGQAWSEVRDSLGEVSGTLVRRTVRAAGAPPEVAYDAGLVAEQLARVGADVAAPGAMAKGFSKIARAAEVAGEASAVARGARVAAADVAAVEALVADHAAMRYARQLGLEVPPVPPLNPQLAGIPAGVQVGAREAAASAGAPTASVSRVASQPSKPRKNMRGGKEEVPSGPLPNMQEVGKRFGEVDRHAALRTQGTQGPSANPRGSNPGDFAKYKAERAFEEAGILRPDGTLTEEAIRGADLVVPGRELRNSSIIQELTRDGSHIEDWAKFKTETVTLPSGQSRQIHFYYNRVTGRVDYHTVDYKIKDPVNLYGDKKP